MRTSRSLILLLVLAVVAACRSSAKVPEGATPDAVKAMADARMAEGDYPAAADLYDAVTDRFPRTPQADESEWLAAEAWFLDGDWSEAQDRYQSFFDSHPLVNLGALGERMYEIGVRRYERGKAGVLGIGLLPTSERGLKALQWITEKLPNGTRADDAFFFIGRARMASHLYDDAVLNFDQILAHYPQSEWTHEARYLRGLSYLAINRGPSYDKDSLVRARRDFSDYVRIIERSEALRTEYADRLEEAKARLSETNERLARKDLKIANFYRSQERFEGERLYLDDAATRYPETEAGREAAARLAPADRDGE